MPANDFLKDEPRLCLLEGPIDFVLAPSVSNLEGSPLWRIIWKPPALSLLTHSTRSNSVAIVARICAVGKVPPTNEFDVEKDDLAENLHYKFHTKNIRVSNALEVDWLVPLPVLRTCLLGRAFGIGMSHIEGKALDPL